MTTAALHPTETGRSRYGGWMPRLRGWLAVLPLVGLCIGLGVQALGHPEVAALAWTLATLAVHLFANRGYGYFRDELYYLLGRYHYAKGNFKDAIDLFSSVPEKSEFYPKAKFLEGLTHVREYHGKIAADSFKSILRKVKQYDDPDKVPKALKEAEELANLSLGRVFYSTKQYNQAIKYFEKLPGADSREGAAPDWGASLFEASWAYFSAVS